MVAAPPRTPRPPRVSARSAPQGTPDVTTNPGLTPQQAIVEADGRPTMFFFRWLLSWRRGADQTISGISVNGELAGSVSNDPITVNGLA